MLDILMSGAGHVGHLQVKRMQCSPFSFKENAMLAIFKSRECNVRHFLFKRMQCLQFSSKENAMLIISFTRIDHTSVS